MSVRVKICFNEIFKDQRKEALLYVDPNFKMVSDLEKHIQKLFNIQSNIYLTISGVLLPSQENILVIHTNDVIMVNKSINEMNNGLNSLTIESGDGLHPTIETENQSNDDIPKRGKRIRKRKKKQVTGINDEEQKPSKRIEGVFNAKPNKLFKESKKLSSDDVGVSLKEANSHIRFSNDDESDEETIDEAASTNHSDVLHTRVFLPVVSLNDVASSIPPDSQVSEGSDKNGILTCKQAIKRLKKIANESGFTDVAASIDFEEMINKIDINSSTEFVPLKEEPKIYDVVGFKILKIGKNYEPQLSEWIIAMVKDVADLDITLHVLAGKEETLCPDGKLSMEICEEEAEQSEILTLRRSEMINAKVFDSD